jgi:hypothetical protein
MLYKRKCHDCGTKFFCERQAKEPCRGTERDECHCIECSKKEGYLIKECPKYEWTDENINQYLLQEL